MSVLNMFKCIADSFPGVGLFAGKGPSGGLSEEEVNLTSLGVHLHEVLGYSTPETISNGRFDQRYFFLLPGRLVSSGEAFVESSEVALRDALVADDRFCMDISPTFIVEMVGPRVFRVRNASTVVAGIAPFSGDGTTASHLPLLEEGSHCINLHFQTPEAAQMWAEALMTERNRLYLPTLMTRDLEFCQAFHAALWKGILGKVENVAEVRFVYFRCTRGEDGPEAALIALYNIFASVVPKGQMARCAPAFLEALGVIATSLTARLCLLSWDITPEFLMAFQAYYRPVLQAAETKRVEDVAKAAAAEDANATEPPVLPPSPSPKALDSSLGEYLQEFMRAVSLGGGEAVEPVFIAELAKYVRDASLDPAFGPNANVLPAIYGYPDRTGTMSMGAVTHARWLAELQAGKGAVALPVSITWDQAVLLLKPTPFCGYFFVDSAIENDDVRRARATCQLLPYSMSERFDAIHVNSGSELDHAAHYIAYLEWDALQRGYEEFEMKNRGNTRVQDLLAIARKVYSVPICTASHLDLATMSAGDVMQDFISQLLDNVENEDCKHIRCLRKVLGHWMTFTGKTSGVVEVPRKAHLITLLLLSNWLSSRPSLPTSLVGRSPLSRTPGGSSLDMGSMLVGRIVEGEDRALIMAIAATDMVLTHGKRVHLLYASATDLFRDFTRVQPYFSAVGLSASMNDFTASAQITYCLQRDLTQYYRDSVYQGQTPLTDTLLFIQDVTSFSLGASPNAIYGKKDEVLSAPFREFLDVLAALPAEEAASPDLEVPAETASSTAASVRALAWTKAKLAWTEFTSMKENQPLGFSKQGGTLVLLDAAGKPCPHKYSLGLECARYRLLGIEPSINSKFYFQSLPYILSLYSGVFGLEEQGLSASAPSSPAAEAAAPPSTAGRDLLEEVLGAWSFNIPNDEAQKNLGSLRSINDQSMVGAQPSTPGAGVAEAPGSGGLLSPSSPRGVGDASLSLVTKGARMAEMCDLFYRAYPHKGGPWPATSEHRRLVQFLECEEQHTVEGVAEFSLTMKLIRARLGGI